MVSNKYSKRIVANSMSELETCAPLLAIFFSPGTGHWRGVWRDTATAVIIILKKKKFLRLLLRVTKQAPVEEFPMNDCRTRLWWYVLSNVQTSTEYLIIWTEIARNKITLPSLWLEQTRNLVFTNVDLPFAIWCRRRVPRERERKYQTNGQTTGAWAAAVI